MMSKGLLCNLVSVSNLDYDIPSIDYVLVVNVFQDIFLDYLLVVPPHREIDFGIK